MTWLIHIQPSLTEINSCKSPILIHYHHLILFTPYLSVGSSCIGFSNIIFFSFSPYFILSLRLSNPNLVKCFLYFKIGGNSKFDTYRISDPLQFSWIWLLFALLYILVSFDWIFYLPYFLMEILFEVFFNSTVECLYMSRLGLTW